MAMPTIIPISTTVPKEIGMPVFLIYQRTVVQKRSSRAKARNPGTVLIRAASSCGGTPGFGSTRTQLSIFRCGFANWSARSYVVKT